jgi:O-methyltransferase
MGFLANIRRHAPLALTGIEKLLRRIKGRFQRSVAGLANQQHSLNDKFGVPLGEITPIAHSQPVHGQPHGDNIDSLLNAICAAVTTPQAAARVLDRVLQDIVRPYHHGTFWGDRLLTLDKTAEFREDPAFQSALKQADSSTGANQYESPDGISWRYHTLIWAAKACLHLPGDFVECGVFRGDMTWMITQTVDLQSAGKRFYLYDTFAGLDPKYSSEEDFPDSPAFFRFIDREYRSSDIETHVRRRFRDEPHVVVTKGVVPDVLHDVSPERIAFLHLDMNSPRAEQAALEFLFSRIAPGGIIIFDDYGWKQFHKQKESADRTMAERGHVILELPTGQGLVVKN